MSFWFEFIRYSLRQIFILQTSMENDQTFDVDSPVALIVYESLNELQQGLGSRNIWMRSFQTSEKV